MARTQRPTSFPVRTESWPFATANGTESRILDLITGSFILSPAVATAKCLARCGLSVSPTPTWRLPRDGPRQDRRPVVRFGPGPRRSQETCPATHLHRRAPESHDQVHVASCSELPL